MPYCPECGNEVSITDKRCSKCGEVLILGGTVPPTGTGIVGTIKGKNNSDGKSRHNIEFVLAIIAVALSVFAVSQSFNNYYYTDPTIYTFIFAPILIGILGAIIVRYYAKPGAIILFIAGISLIIFGIQGMFWPMIFYIITAIVAFVLN